MKKLLLFPLMLLFLTNCFMKLQDPSSASSHSDEIPIDPTPAPTPPIPHPDVKDICKNNPRAEICSYIDGRTDRPLLSSGYETVSVMGENYYNETIDSGDVNGWKNGWTVPFGSDFINIKEFAHHAQHIFNNSDIIVDEQYFTQTGKLLSQDIYHNKSGQEHVIYFIKNGKQVDLSPKIDLNSIEAIFELLTYKDSKGHKFYEYGPPMYITHEPKP